MKLLLKYLVVISVVAIFYSCGKHKDYPDTPAITFKSIAPVQDASGKDAYINVTIGFTDGDGDIGHLENDTNPPFNLNGPYYYDFVVTYFKKVSGAWTEQHPLFPFSGRLPYLTPEGEDKALTGEIKMKIFAEGGLAGDSVRYDIFIYDRALNKSNVITTDALAVHS